MDSDPGVGAARHLRFRRDDETIEPLPIQAIVFDVGRVLVEWDLRHLFAKLIADEAELDWFLANVVTEEWHLPQDDGRPLGPVVEARIAEFPDHAELIRAYVSRYNETIPGLVPGMKELVERLGERPVPLYAITNFGAEFWAGYRPTEPLFDNFRDIVVSGVERIVKPDPAIFASAERRFGYPAGAMLFIDDNIANIETARALGWQVHRFADAAGLEADLRERGLLN
jgi:2-haloacid dehalogenase